VLLGDALRYADELLDVLAAAHAQGIIHRDVKPDNLFVTREGRLKVLDFGIARMLEGSPRSARTAFGLTMGTPHYMPPEQIVGGTIDHRADLYAVGATLFRLAAGRHAHEGHADMELLVKVSTEPAPPLCSVAPHAPAPLGLIVDRALALRPDDRYPDARTMQGDVQALRRGEAPPFATAHPPVRSVAAPRSAPSTAVGVTTAAGGRTPTGVAPAGYTPTGVASAGHPPMGVASAEHPPTGVAPAGYTPTGVAPAQAPLPAGVAAAGYARNEVATAAPPPGYGPTGGVTAQAPAGYAPAGGATMQAPAGYAAGGSAAAQATVRHAPAGVAAAQATASRLPVGAAAAPRAPAAALPTVAAAPAPLRAASAFAPAPSDAGPTRDRAGRRGELDRRARYLVAFGALALCLLLLFGGIWLFGGDASSASQDPPLPGPDPTGGEAPPPGTTPDGGTPVGGTPGGGTPGGGTPGGGTPGGGTPGGGASPPPRVAPLPGTQLPGPGKGHEKDNDKRREHEKDRHKDGGKKGGR
jgi:eukaryotic-like serine/threonine-protein kinase